MLKLPPGPWTAPSAAVYAADGQMVCSLGDEDVVQAYRARGDTDGSQIMQAANALASVPALQDALIKAFSVLTQLQDHPEQARDIISQGYFGHALVRTQRALALLPDYALIPPAADSGDAHVR